VPPLQRFVAVTRFAYRHEYSDRPVVFHFGGVRAGIYTASRAKAILRETEVNDSMTLRAFVIRHLPFEDLGLWEARLTAPRWSVRYFQPGIEDLSPCGDPDAELLIVLGGPIGVYEEAQYPFLGHELEIIRRRLKRRLPILGVCLGAQLIAAAAGARVYPTGIKEIGWAPVSLTAAGNESCLRHLADCDYTVLHWHGDTFDLPDGATLLASTHLVRHQAFTLGPNVLALQFHVETDPRTLERWFIGHACELSQADVKPVELRRATERLPVSFPACSVQVLESWLAHVGLS